MTVILVVLLVVVPVEVYSQILREDLAAAQPVDTLVSATVLNSIKQSLSVRVKELPSLPATADILEKPT